MFSVVCVFRKPAWGTMRSSPIRFKLSEKYFSLGCFYHYNLNNLQCINEKIGCVERSLVWLCDSSIYLFNSSLSAVQDYAVWRRLSSSLFLDSAYVYFYFLEAAALVIGIACIVRQSKPRAFGFLQFYFLLLI